MKRILSTVSLLTVSLFLSAQNIDYSNFNLPASHVDYYKYTGNVSYPAAATGSNQVWDYSSLSAAGNDSIVYLDAKDSITGYPAVYNYYYYDLNSPTGATIDGYRFFNIDQSGFYRNAFFTEAFSESLAAFTGTASDQLVIPSQRIVFPDTLYLLKFPVTAQSSWSSTRTRILNYNISIAGYGLSNTPGYFKAHQSETRTVVGDGTIIIPDEDGNPMPPVPVYMISVNQTLIDSIYLAGSPAPAALLSAFGLSQGLTEVENFVLFYARNGAGLPIAAYTEDAAGNAIYFSYRPQIARAALGIGITEMESSELSVYPNPAAIGTRLQVDLSQHLGAKKFSLYSLSGFKVQSAYLNPNESYISLSADLRAGVYILSLEDESGNSLARTQVQLK